MKSLLINTGLFILAILIIFVVAPLGLVFTFVKAVEISLKGKRKGVKHQGVKYASSRMLGNGLGLDIFGGIINKDLFDWVFVKEVPEAVKFGIQGMSISGVIGLNSERNTLTIAGKVLAWILNKIDPGHSEMAADNNRDLLERPSYLGNNMSLLQPGSEAFELFKAVLNHPEVKQKIIENVNRIKAKDHAEFED